MRNRLVGMREAKNCILIKLQDSKLHAVQIKKADCQFHPKAIPSEQSTRRACLMFAPKQNLRIPLKSLAAKLTNCRTPDCICQVP